MLFYMTKLEKFKELFSDKKYEKSRMKKAIARGLSVGHDLDDDEYYFNLVLAEYETGKHKSLCWKKREFKHTMKFVREQTKDLENKPKEYLSF